MFRKMINYESLKRFQKKSIMELNLAWQLKYKLANWGSFDVSKVASLQCTDYKSDKNRLHHRFIQEIICFK